MSGKAFFIDTTVCTACRGCQIACKQWNQLPATETENWGSMQNPKDLSFYTYKLVRFSEHMGPDNKPVWYFFPDQCRHCLAPPCQEAAEYNAPGGIIIDSLTGAVLYTDKLKKANAEEVKEACPFNIPRAQKGTGYMSKCNMCVDRVNNGLLPACVKTCPTGAMNFGDRDKMVDMAKSRLKEVKAKFPNATLSGLEDLRVFYLLADKPDKYYMFASATSAPKGMDRKMALKKIGRSLKDLSREWQMLNKLAG
ncbi:MAG: formate dehydrogenase [Deltaproteobacteria bacterium]|nr:formate dehydrogenase [Deltaproteobacteria bacterium]MCF8118672.1 formate dehydrogenase [Deltaproteobacteria bacterium]